VRAAPIHKDKRFQFAAAVVATIFAFAWAGKTIPDPLLDVIQMLTLGVLAQSKLGDWFRHKWPTEKAPDK
jgi:hypothetical protein